MTYETNKIGLGTICTHRGGRVASMEMGMIWWQFRKKTVKRRLFETIRTGKI